jgi:S-formylglutathione hydrolase FrmB
VVSIVAVVLTGAMAFLLINRHYQYYPTVAALFGDDGGVELPQLEQLKEQVKRTGQLPGAGVMVEVPGNGPKSGFNPGPMYVYLPPIWFTDPQPQLPVLLLLPGEPGDATNWSVGGHAVQTADAFAAQHGGRTPIIVMPNPFGSGDTECVDSKLGKAETYVMEDVLGTVTDTFNPATGPTSTAVAGLSAGGMCSVMLTLRHPDVFTAFGDYSGLSAPELDPPGNALQDLFDGNQQAMDAHDPVKILQAQRFPKTSGWFEVGQSDTEPLADIQALVPEAQAAGIATCLLVRPGAHDFDFWTESLQNSLPWLAWRLGLTPPPTSTPATCTPPIP